LASASKRKNNRLGGGEQKKSAECTSVQKLKPNEMVYLLKAEPRYIHAGGRRGGFSASAQGVIGRLPVSDLLKEGSRNEAEDNAGKETREYEIAGLF
jgi:hypothetical protein